MSSDRLVALRQRAHDYAMELTSVLDMEKAKEVALVALRLSINERILAETKHIEGIERMGRLKIETEFERGIDSGYQILAGGHEREIRILRSDLELLKQGLV
jgi:hypothetical protein